MAARTVEERIAIIDEKISKKKADIKVLAVSYTHLGGKEVVKGALAQPGGLGDLLHRGVGHAILLDKLEARVQHFDTQLLPIGDTENFR